MQVSRFWRMNAARYRLEGVQFEDGDVALTAYAHDTAQDDEPQAAAAPTLEATMHGNVAHERATYAA
jgi:hypothetical protein